MIDHTCISAPLVLNGEVVRVLKSSRIFLFFEISFATIKTDLIFVIIRLSGRILPTIRQDSRTPEKQAG